MTHDFQIHADREGGTIRAEVVAAHDSLKEGYVRLTWQAESVYQQIADRKRSPAITGALYVSLADWRKAVEDTHALAVPAMPTPTD